MKTDIIKLITFFLKIIFRPVLKYLKNVYTIVKLKLKYPTIQLQYNIKANNVKFGRHNHLSTNVKISNSSLGDFSYLAESSNLSNATVGKFTCIGPNVQVGLGRHPLDKFISIHPVFYSMVALVGVTFADKQYFIEQLPTIIGNDVWIGANVVIPGGISIGDGAIIAAGAVVTMNVPPYAIVGGVPAKIIRYRFSEDQIKELLISQWWNKDEFFMQKNFKLMHDINNLNKLFSD